MKYLNSVCIILSLIIPSATIANDMEIINQLLQEHLRQQQQSGGSQSKNNSKYQNQQRKCVYANPSDGIKMLGIESVGNNTWRIYYQYYIEGNGWSSKTSDTVTVGTIQKYVGPHTIGFEFYNC